MKTNKLKIDEQVLIHALQDSGTPGTYYLNVITGEIVLVNEYGDFELEELENEIEEHSEDFLSIEPINSSQAHQIMVDFVEHLEDKNIQERLFTVLERKKPFYHFKESLIDYPELRKQWFDYENAQLKEIAREWLENNDLIADLI